MAENLHTQVAARLRRAGQRYTSGRRGLVDALSKAARPLTATELSAGVRHLPQSTAYRNLALLEAVGVVRRVQGGDEYSRFELADELTGRHHHHLICVSCGAVEDFEPPRRVEQSVAEIVGLLVVSTGFRAEAHRLDLLGTCSTCAP